MSRNRTIPTYSLNSFISKEHRSKQFQIEPFDANRHFQVEYPHRHDFFELLYIEEGSGIHVIDNNRYDITPPCVFFMSPGQAHKLELSNDIKGYIYIFTAEFYIIDKINQNRLIEFPFFYTIDQNNPPLTFKEEEKVKFITTLFQRALTNCSEELSRALLNSILIECEEQYEVDSNRSTRCKGDLLVKQLYHLIEENYLKNRSVSEYAEILHITPEHLTQTVKKITGKRTTDLIKSKQVIETKRLLIYTSMGISEIAAHLNFADQSYFSKFFKREVGETPLEFRRKYMKNT